MFNRTARKLRLLGKVKRSAYLRGRRDQKTVDDDAFNNNIGYLRESFSQETSTIRTAEQEISASTKQTIKALKEQHKHDLEHLRSKHNDDINHLKLHHKKELDEIKKQHEERYLALKDDYNIDLKKQTDHLSERDTARENEHKKLKDELIMSRKELDKQTCAWQEENRYLKEVQDRFLGAMHKVAQHAEEISKSSARIIGPDRETFDRLADIVAANESRVKQLGPALNNNRRPELP